MFFFHSPDGAALHRMNTVRFSDANKLDTVLQEVRDVH